MLLLPGIGHARVLLGEIDLRGIAGWRGLNAVLASALDRLADSTRARRRDGRLAAPAGRHARASAGAGTVVGRTERGMRVEVLGLYAVLSGPRRDTARVEELDVRITRMDPDEGRIFVSDRLATTGQLRLPLAEAAAAAARSSNTGRG